MSYKIEEIKCGITEGGIACGPIEGNIMVSLKFNDGNKSMWLNNAEVLGTPNFYLTETDIFDDIMKEDDDNEEFIEFLNKSFIDKFNSISLGDYEDIATSMKGKEDEEDSKLIKLLVQVARCPLEEQDGVIKNAIGKTVSEIAIDDWLF